MASEAPDSVAGFAAGLHQQPDYRAAAIDGNRQGVQERPCEDGVVSEPIAFDLRSAVSRSDRWFVQR
jgi:hypothetical protein